MSTESNIEIRVAYEEKTFRIRGVLINCDRIEYALRHVYAPREVHLKMDDSTVAFSNFQSSLGGVVDDFILSPGCHQEFEVDLRAFFFPKAGLYRCWIDYDSSIQTAIYDARQFDAVRVRSNEVSIFVAEASRSNPASPDQDQFSNEVGRQQRRPWWRWW